MVRGAALLGALIGLAGCTTTPAAELVVVVRTDLAVPTAIDRIDVEVNGRVYSLTGLTLEHLPATLTLTSDGATTEDINVVASGYLGDALVVRERATTTFVVGPSRALEIWLLERCLISIRDCPPGWSCEFTCIPERREGSGLPTTGAVLDGGLGDGGLSDGAVSDAGVRDAALIDGALIDGAMIDGAVTLELCDSTDTDGDGMIDESAGNADVESSLEAGGAHDHCGRCDNACSNCIAGACAGLRAVEATIGESCRVVSDLPSSGRLECGPGTSLDALVASMSRLESGGVQFETQSPQICYLGPTDGTVYCVGEAYRGERPMTCPCSDRCLECPFPIGSAALTPLTPVSDFDVGWAHGCSIVEGTVYCWGANERGQLGRSGSTLMVPRGLPVSTEGATSFARVATGNRFSCAVEASGERRVYCWGANQQLALGRVTGPTTNQVPRPVLLGDSLGPLTDVLDVSCAGGAPLSSQRGSPHCCALKTDGEVYCWGSGGFGQLDGIVTSLVRNYPRQVPRPSGMGRARSVEVAPSVSCAVTVDDEVWCWGDPGSVLSSSTASNGPLQIPFEAGVAIRDVSLSAGITAREDAHIFAVASTWSGEAYCWGVNDSFQCTETPGEVFVPQRLTP